MPEINGWDVLSFFRQTQPPSRVIVMTAYGEEDTGRIAGEKGAWAFVEKPFLIDKIKGILREPASCLP
jgi:DNA-binding NtrC family response regulator